MKNIFVLLLSAMSLNAFAGEIECSISKPLWGTESDEIEYQVLAKKVIEPNHIGIDAFDFTESDIEIGANGEALYEIELTPRLWINTKPSNTESKAFVHAMISGKVKGTEDGFYVNSAVFVYGNKFEARLDGFIENEKYPDSIGINTYVFKCEFR